MLHKEYITKLLDLEYADVENLLVDASRIEIHLRLERRTCECPACGALTDAVHDYRTQRVKDIPVQGKPVVLIFRKRRYRCASCGKRFYEKNCLLPRFSRYGLYENQSFPKRYRQGHERFSLHHDPLAQAHGVWKILPLAEGPLH